MKSYLFVAIGGFLGAICRFALKNIQFFNYKGEFPVNTLTVNVTGAFALAFFLALSLDVIKLGDEVRQGVAIGFLGAYTTFSTLCKEFITLLDSFRYAELFLYTVLSIALGLLAVYAGMTSAQVLLAMTLKKKNDIKMQMREESKKKDGV
ncbi:MAG: CrcB family protein [Clostridia bacterium]|nr:CrcB family protein [Clostridia bacterium]